MKWWGVGEDGVEDVWKRGVKKGGRRKRERGVRGEGRRREWEGREKKNSDNNKTETRRIRRPDRLRDEGDRLRVCVWARARGGGGREGSCKEDEWWMVDE